MLTERLGTSFGSILARERGRPPRWLDGRAGLATIHPSVILRIYDDAERREAFSGLAGDLRLALRLANTED
jgi:hypothetical protein